MKGNGKVSISTGKNVKRVVVQGRGTAYKRGVKTPTVNLSNTYGIQRSSGAPGKGAVTQGKPATLSVSKAKSKIRGN